MTVKHVLKYIGKEYVSAGNILYRYRYDNGKYIPEFLLQYKFDIKKKKFWYEDTGGKLSIEDKTIKFTAARETSEELNGSLIGTYPINELNNIDKYKNHIDECTDYIHKLMHNAIFYPNDRTRYALFLVKIPDDKDYDFGIAEYHPEFYLPRSLKWVSINEIIKIKYNDIHPRIRHFYNILKKISSR